MLFTLHLAAVDNRPSPPLTPRAELHSLLLPPSPAPFRREAPGAGAVLHLDLSRRFCLIFFVLFCSCNFFGTQVKSQHSRTVDGLFNENGRKKVIGMTLMPFYYYCGFFFSFMVFVLKICAR